MRAKTYSMGATVPTQQTSQIPAALPSQSKIKPHLQPQAKSVVKYLTLSPKRQSTRYISGPEHLNLSCCLWMPQGGRCSSCQARNWELYICRRRAAHLHSTKEDDNTKQPIDVHLWCVNSWANRPSEPLHHPSATIVRFHLCLWARNAFETRRGDVFEVTGEAEPTADHVRWRTFDRSLFKALFKFRDLLFKWDPSTSRFHSRNFCWGRGTSGSRTFGTLFWVRSGTV